MKGDMGETFARHALPGRGYVPLPVCLRIVRRTTAYNPVQPPFAFLSDVLAALRRLTGATKEAVRGYWAPNSPLSTFHGSQGWVELALNDQPVIALIPEGRPPASARAYPAFVQQVAIACLQEWAQKVQ